MGDCLRAGRRERLVLGSGLRVRGLGSRAQGLEFRVKCAPPIGNPPLFKGPAY